MSGLSYSYGGAVPSEKKSGYLTWIIILGALMVVGVATFFIYKKMTVGLSVNSSSASTALSAPCSLRGKYLFTFPAGFGLNARCGDGSSDTGCWVGSGIDVKAGKHVSEGPFSFALPKGVYKVTLQGYDDHLSKKTVEPYERFSVRLYSSSNQEITRSGPSADIPDATLSNQTITNTALVVSKDSTSIKAYHYYAAQRIQGGYNDIAPVCVLFEEIN